VFGEAVYIHSHSAIVHLPPIRSICENIRVSIAPTISSWACLDNHNQVEAVYASARFMESFDKVEAIRSLHQDLISFSENRLPVVDDFLLGIEAHLEYFRNFLERKPRSEVSRRTVLEGSCTRAQSYSVDD
jgi:hypothetical protein